MRRETLGELSAFIAVARERSFTKAAAKLNVSQAALSYTIRTLEERLGLRLLTRTTRSVSVTNAGDRLLRSVGPMLDEIGREISALSALRDKPAGTVRITTVEHATETILWPAITKLLSTYPDINIELINDYGLTDIVVDRYDAGVRLGEQVDKDMIAVRIGPDFRMAIVAAPSYFGRRPRPLKPQDLTQHDCISMRLPTSGGLYAWDFRKGAREVKVRVQGRAVFNHVGLIRDAALRGHGVAQIVEDFVEPLIKAGKLVRVLEDWCPLRPGYHLYYPSRRQPSPAFVIVVDALRYRTTK
jgi:DNA-binding transcriptional LysR family regulator